MTESAGEIGFFAAVKGAWTALRWCWEKRKAILQSLLVVGALSPALDQFAPFSPHVMKRVWHNMRHDQARESADQIAAALKPDLVRMEKEIVEVKENQILTQKAFEKLPGGAKAMKAAIYQKTRDSVAAVEAAARAKSWHPPESSVTNLQPELRKVAIIGERVQVSPD